MLLPVLTAWHVLEMRTDDSDSEIGGIWEYMLNKYSLIRDDWLSAYIMSSPKG